VAVIEHSVLQDHEIPGLLYQRYDIPAIREVYAVSGGSANCWHVLSADGRYLLKELQSSYHLDDIRTEPRLNDFLRSRGVPTATFLPTRTGEYVWTLRNRVFHLQEYLEGRISARNAAPDWLVTESAKMLATIHRVLRGFPQLRGGFPETWFRFDQARLRDDYNALVDRASTLEDRETADGVRADLEFELSALGEADSIRVDPSELTYCNSHGDYHVQQIICRDEEIRAVIDFSAARYQPACWEIARSYTYADPACAAASIVPANMVAYVETYMRSSGLTRHDLEAMPRLYYLQLLRSRYGYREYLLDGAVGGARLLEFASWRTALCRWLRENMDDLSHALISLLP
jgi:Ser/Thr protein kinase RdoA (MazF antagonist)